MDPFSDIPERVNYVLNFQEHHNDIERRVPYIGVRIFPNYQEQECERGRCNFARLVGSWPFLVI